MDKIKIFISSVQKEFRDERATLRDYLLADPVLRRFFEPFLFEDLPAADRRADELYLSEVAKCGIYIGILGVEYGREDADGFSSTQREFNEATKRDKYRLVFVKGLDDKGRHPKIQKLIETASAQLVRRRFSTQAELIAGVYSALVDYLASKDLLRDGPFDAALCRDAVIDDLSEEKILWFLDLARRARGFPLADDAKMRDVLTHLNLIKNDKPTHAAILLFGKQPQKFLISSEVKCAHFHGAEVQKPIPYYQVYKGTVFDLVDKAVDFVLSKINLAVGTRKLSVQAPVAYEMPQEVVREAIVNAVSHRDYTSNGSVQVMLFSDRLEVWNPGTLPPSLTLKKLRQPHASVPGNPLLAEPLYLTKYIERMGTGTRDMIKRCRNFGLSEPEFRLTDGFVATIRRKPNRAFEAVGGKITLEGTEQDEAHVGTKSGLSRDQVEILKGCIKESKIGDLMKILSRTNRTKFRDQVLKSLIREGYIEMTIPDKPKSSNQKYQLSKKGAAYLKSKGKK